MLEEGFILNIKMKSIKKFIAATVILLLSFESTYATWSLSQSVWDTNTKADSTSFLWIKKSRTAKILDNFKDYQQELLFENVPISSEDESLIFDSESKLRSLQDIMNRIETRKDQLKERKRNITKKKFDLKTAIADLDKSISETEDSIRVIESDIVDKNKNISELTWKIYDAKTKIAESKETILKYLTYIYSKGDWMYDWNDNDIDVIRSIVLNDWNLWDLLNDIHFKTLVEISWQNLVDLHRQLEKEYYYSKEEFKKEKLEALKLKSELNAKNNELESQKTYKEDLLNVTKWQEALYNKLILSKQERVWEVKEKIDNLNVNYADIFNNIGNKYDCNVNFSASWAMNIWPAKKWESPKCAEIRTYFLLEKKLRESSNDNSWKNPFYWPVQPNRWISTYYHDEEYFSSLWSEHEAIDIPVSQWTDIIAPSDWYVYFVSPPASWAYAYIALKHAWWFVTVYWHVSEILVQPFEYIQAWQVFAKSWWAPWTPWAWPMTSWAHLHFELYKDRQSVDPLRFLDVTQMRFENLDLKYRYKYIEDLKLKYWNKVNTDRFQKFYIAWDSEIDRQKSLLDKYAAPGFNDWNIWVEEAIAWKVDPSFLMCIWLAETWLWKHLKTANNVWNIWNTDSWGTYDFTNPREWIYWMTKTLNNRYLRKSNSIDMLSRWWNKDWAIYASSSKNWHNNLVKCLSSLKWRFVEDDYKFRISDSED